MFSQDKPIGNEALAHRCPLTELIVSTMRLVGSLLMVITISSCAANSAFRTAPSGQTPCVSRSAEDCSESSYFLLAEDESVDYEIPMGIIEFDDQGALHDRARKDALMGQLRNLASESDLLIAVFAHGWKNNAEYNNGNLRDFKTFLRRLAVADRIACGVSSCASRRVVGVYLGWRGLSATWEPFRSLSFWNRKKRAHRVGQDGVTEILGELRKIDASTRNSKLVLIGHSFGGGLVYTATQQILQRDMAFPRQGSISRTLADLIVLVNPAFEAARMTAIREKSEKLRFGQSQRPILAILTSRTDVATRLAFPVGRILSNLFTDYNPARPDQGKLNRTAIGHYEPYQTHRLYLEPPSNTRQKGQDLGFRAALCSWRDFQSGTSDQWDLQNGLVLERNAEMSVDGQRNNPYINVTVADEVISGHNQIWSDEFLVFMYRFIAVQDAGGCRGS